MGKDRNSYSKTDLDYFIVHGYVSNDCTDYNTLIPVLEKHRKAFGEDCLKEVNADSGYCSEKNLLYLKEKGITSYIKLQDHEKRKSRAWQEDMGKYYNMKYEVFEDEHYDICHDGREHKAKFLYRYHEEKNPDREKVMKIHEWWEELKEESNWNIQSEKGILNRQIRSISDRRTLWRYQGERKFPAVSLSLSRKSI